MTFDRPRGTRDFKPDAMERRRWLEQSFRESFRRFGYREVQTPTFEHTDLFRAKSGPNVVEETYTFRDKGDREISLRPELTAPVLRFYVAEMTSDPKPLKLYYYGPCFRYEEPQEGRYREFWQFGLELLGPEGPNADAEVIAVATQALRDAGLSKFTLHVGHIGVLRALVGALNASDAQKAETFRRIDKDDDELDDFLDGIGAQPRLAAAIVSIARHHRTIHTKDESAVAKFFQEARDAIHDKNEAVETALKSLEDTVPLLRAYGVDEIELDLGVARGLDYYTGVVFEFHATELGSQSQIGGGGAYALAELFGGEKVGSAGFGLGFDRILLALDKAGALPKPAPTAHYYVVPIGAASRAVALDLARQLRAKGKSVDVDLMGRGPGKALQYASKIGAPFVLLLGDKEIANGQVTLRDMTTGEQSLVDMTQLVSRD